MQHFFIRQQIAAQLFQAMQLGRLAGRFAAHKCQRRANRLHFHRAHDLADVLHLTPPGLVASRHALSRTHRFAQSLRDVDFFDAITRQFDKLFAERLQIIHLLFALGFRGW